MSDVHIKASSSFARTLRAQAAPFAKTALLRFGGYAACRTLLPSRNVAILRYHAICGDEGHAYADPSICISPSAFSEHVRYLAANYTVLPLPEVVLRLRHSRPLPRNSAVITFDDGYADNLAAARTLHQFGLPATFYITAGCLAGEQPFWPIEIRALIHGTRRPLVRLTAAGTIVEIVVDSELARTQAVRNVTKLFKAHSIAAREAMREELRAQSSAVNVPDYMLRWDQVAEMHRLGMTIGSHTLTHPNLPNAGPRDARYEIASSKARLERELGIPVTMFSYPNGGAERYMTSEIAYMVREAGFESATTSRNAFVSRASDLFALERIQVHERLEDLVFALEVERFGFTPTARLGEVQ
jgi:peptidoglycan/xylan/chitin deacetylase (PgdA/CDA1 family)